MPSKSPKKAVVHDMDEIGHLIGKRVLVPHRIFPNETVPKGNAGWEAQVKGVNKANRNHLDIVFEDHWEEYYFPYTEVRTWKVLGEVKKTASPKKNAKEPAPTPPPESDSEEDEEDADDEEKLSSDIGDDDDFEVDADASKDSSDKAGDSDDGGDDDNVDDEATETEDLLPARTPVAAVVEDKDDAVVSPAVQPSTGKKRIVSKKVARVTVAAAAAKRKAPEPAAPAAAKVPEETEDDEDEQVDIVGPGAAVEEAGPTAAPAAAANKATAGKARNQATKRGREPEVQEEIKEEEEEDERPTQRARTDDVPWYVTAAWELGFAFVGVGAAYFAMSKVDF